MTASTGPPPCPLEPYLALAPITPEELRAHV
jgi:hypothetical protein